MRKRETDQILYFIEYSIDKLNDLIRAINRRYKSTADKPKMYRQILNRRINLTSTSRQMRGIDKERSKLN
jgi:hypothetical protein